MSKITLTVQLYHDHSDFGIWNLKYEIKGMGMGMETTKKDWRKNAKKTPSERIKLVPINHKVGVCRTNEVNALTNPNP